MESDFNKYVNRLWDTCEEVIYDVVCVCVCVCVMHYVDQ